MNTIENLTPFITPTTDSLQFAWRTLDRSTDGTFGWGKHGGVQHLIDNVSFGRFDGTATVFSGRHVDMEFGDTFSRSDPAHTGWLSNDEQGQWSGIAGVGFDRDFAAVDSLSVEITDFNGITASNVFLWWRHDDGGSGSFGAWNSKLMDFADPNLASLSDEGTYRQILGADDGSVEDAEGTPGNGRIWKAGTTVQYYVKVTDDGGNEGTFPHLEGGSDPREFSVLPFGNMTPNGNRILLVDDHRWTVLDFEKSTGFDPAGGAGFGGFHNAVWVQPEFLVRDALDLIYDAGGADIVDKYDVPGAPSTIQAEPRGLSDVARGLGGYMNDFGVPEYDAILWMLGYLPADLYADATRLELRTYLDNGGYLLSNGDNVNFHLGNGGDGEAPGFLADYLGTSFPSAADEMTDNRVLDIAGEAGSEVAGYLHGVYGECPLRRKFDRLTRAAPGPQQENRVLYRYANSTANDNGRPAVIYNKRTSGEVDLGAAANFAFGLSALQSRVTIAAVLDQVLHSPTLFGLTDPGYDPVHVPGLSAPKGFAFHLDQAAPNPFREDTSIAFGVARRTHVAIEVYNVLGQRVRTLVDETLEPNSYVRSWDGRANDGTRVSSGIYFYRMDAGEFRATKKAVVLK
jgi:hypothetical protein